MGAETKDGCSCSSSQTYSSPDGILTEGSSWYDELCDDVDAGLDPELEDDAGELGSGEDSVGRA